MVRVKYWEMIADNLSKAGWSLGLLSAIDSNGRTIWIADAHRGDGKRFVARADEKLTAFVELESAIRAAAGLRFSARRHLRARRERQLNSCCPKCSVRVLLSISIGYTQ